MTQKRTPDAIIRAYRRNMLRDTVCSYFETEFRRDFKDLDPRERIDVMTRLARYAFPALSSVVVEDAGTTTLDEQRQRLAALAGVYEGKENGFETKGQ